ncbi:hypothetical protein EJB05_12118, partial [Eragrostis curvula]
VRPKVLCDISEEIACRSHDATRIHTVVPSAPCSGPDSTRDGFCAEIDISGSRNEITPSTDAAQSCSVSPLQFPFQMISGNAHLFVSLCARPSACAGVPAVPSNQTLRFSICLSLSSPPTSQRNSSLRRPLWTENLRLPLLLP